MKNSYVENLIEALPKYHAVHISAEDALSIEHMEMYFSWCNKKFKNKKDHWVYFGLCKFGFLNPTDAVEFKLRFG